jgi:hypothetical protein
VHFGNIANFVLFLHLQLPPRTVFALCLHTEVLALYAKLYRSTELETTGRRRNFVLLHNYYGARGSVVG